MNDTNNKISKNGKFLECVRLIFEAKHKVFTNKTRYAWGYCYVN